MSNRMSACTNGTLAECVSRAQDAQLEADRLSRQAAAADYTQADLRVAGVSRHEARKLSELMGTSTQIVQTGTLAGATPAGDDIVTVIPAAEEPGALARNMFAQFQAYARDLSLRGSIPQRASWATFTDDGQITALYRIEARYYVPSPTCSAPTTVGPHLGHRLQQLLQSQLYRSTFPDPASVFLLGPAVPLPRPLPLGYAGGRSVRNLSSYYVRDLHASPTLRDASTVNQA